MRKGLTTGLAMVLALSFILAGIAVAGLGPGQLTPVGPPPYKHEMGFLKNPVPKDFGQADVLPAEVLPAEPNATPLGKPEATCTINNWQGPPHYAIGGLIYGAEVYAVYQDPTEACGGAPYTFQIWSVVMPLRTYTGLGTYTFNVRAQIYAVDSTNPACPVPGALLYQGPIVSRTVPGTRTNVEAPFDEWVPACVDGPYFAAFNFPNSVGPGNHLRAYVDHQFAAGGLPFRPCASYNEYGTGWYDVGADLCCIGYPLPPVAGVNLQMWSYGYPNPDNECHVPGVCFLPEKNYCGFPNPWDLTGYVSEWTIPASWNDVINGPNSADPNGIPSTMYWTRFTNNTPCTLLQARVLVDPAGLSGPNPDMNISIFAVNYTTKMPTTRLYGPVNFPYATLYGTGGSTNWVTATFGNPVLGMGDFAVVCEPGPATLANMYGPNTNPNGNALAFYGDYPFSPYCSQVTYPCRSGAAIGALGNAPHYFCDPLLQGAGYLKFEWRIQFYKCCVYTEPCPEPMCRPSYDSWATHAHDFQRTSASKLGLGTDACDIHLAWKANTTKAFMYFNNVSVAGGKVFCSDDQAVHCFDLAGGGPPLWTYFDPAGITTGDGMRNNITIVGDKLYGSGGSAQSFFCLDTLGNLVWSRHFNSQGGGGNDRLCGPQRFSVSVVTGGVAYVGDEAGCLWAFDAATGTNHAGWPTNPVTMPDGGGIWHSPAYDGSRYLYAATVKGHIYKVDKANGSLSLLFTEPHGLEFRSGCSYDVTESALLRPNCSSSETDAGNMIYAASYGGAGTDPKRFKITSTGTLVWSFSQGASLYGPPTIGLKKVYFPPDTPAAGVLLCNKFSGALEFNFADVGVGQVPNPVTLTCDNYMFIGDRSGQWSLVDVDAKMLTWRRQFYGGNPGIVLGTALAHHYGNGKDYAVMSILQDVTAPGARGAVLCWDLNATPRPMMEQLVFNHTIGVPLGTGLVTGHHLANVIRNMAGCANLTVTDPLPAFNLNPPMAAKMTPTITAVSERNALKAAQTAEQAVGTEYLSFFNETYAGKQALISGAAQAPDEEGVVDMKSRVRFREAKNRANLAAGADILRTMNVHLDTPGPIAGGARVGLTWNYDGTGLERGLDDEYIEIQSNDPDFYPEDPSGAILGYPAVVVHYLGGCPFQWHHYLYFNGYEAWRRETVSNFGAFADADAATEGLDWGVVGLAFANKFLYDGGLFIIQEGYPKVAADFYSFERRFLPDPSPISQVCGIDYQDMVPLGRSVAFDWYDGGGCPPYMVVDEDYIDVLGEFTASAYIDTFEASSTAMGVEVSQVEIGACDLGTGYGNFKLIEYKIKNRDAVLKTNLIAGAFIDWDLDDDAYLRVPEAGAIAQWDSTADPAQVPWAFGMAILPSYTSAASSDRVDGASFKMMWSIANNYRMFNPSCPECRLDTDPVFIQFITTYNGAGEDTPLPTPSPWDKSQIFAWPEFGLGPLGEKHLYMAIFGVDATSNDRAIITDNLRKMAFRVNKWAGFARGDVNDDGRVDAIDVAWLAAWLNGSNIPIFPWDGNGDVNASGITEAGDLYYLFNYLMGGPAPRGAWRFNLMP